MRRAMRWKVPVALVALLAGGLAALGLVRAAGAPMLDDAAFAARYATPLAPPAQPLRIYHLGHSLVGRDMPAMLAQLAGNAYASQLGWGTSLKGHWTGDVAGFDTENAHPFFRPAPEAIDSGDYGIVVLTEMVEIRDAIRYFDSAAHLARWTARARAANPDVRVYLYESWHRLDDAEGWLARLDADPARYWEGGLLRPAMAQDGVGTIFVIPAGQVMAAVVRRIEAGGVPGLTRREDLFSQAADGTGDPIHLNDIGAYLVALTHFAVLTQQSPVGLPHALLRADGTAADAPAADAARMMQETVWDVVRRHPPTGLPQIGG